MDAIDRIRAALQSVPRGKSAMSGITERGAVQTKATVAVIAGDVVELAGEAGGDEIVSALRKGCQAGVPARTVYIQADDLYHLLDAAGGAHKKRGG